MKVFLISGISKRDLEELLGDYQCVGLLELKIEEYRGGLKVSFDEEEWRNSKVSTGIPEEVDDAELLKSELEGMSEEANITVVEL